ncbi:MAG: hypothetical protein HY834_03365 [Devosia nanyangense]|uniref:CoxF protein n=1 Tax=Devosia nanyangense TaxID=1228055 RepID=A0A933L053_9HYPH|nr:hypothetical protein [Devosia nanyangense]
MNGQLVTQDDEAAKRRRRRNSIALGLVLGFLVLLFYVLTIVKMGPGIISQRDL